MLAIKNNLMAEQASRQLSNSYDDLADSVSKLSSGLRINNSGDDAAGLAVRELIRADIATLRQGSRNARDAISMLQSAEGALSVVDDILIRMSELAEQAATESYSPDQRKIMDQEFQQLTNEIDRIAENTSFNGLKLLGADTSTYNIHLGSVETLDIGTKNMTAAGLGVGGVKSTATLNLSATTIGQSVTVSAATTVQISFGATGQQALNVAFSAGTYTLAEVVEKFNAVSRITSGEEYDAANIYYDEDNGTYSIRLTALWGADDNDITMSSSANTVFNGSDWTVTDGTGSRTTIADVTSAVGAMNTVAGAIRVKDTYRAKLGYMMNRLESATSVIDIQAENLLAAESRISDVDVASEMAAMTRSQVLTQAGISMLSQANSMPQMALTLLQQ